VAEKPGEFGTAEKKESVLVESVTERLLKI
jgi:hypothetical protein